MKLFITLLENVNKSQTSAGRLSLKKQQLKKQNKTTCVFVYACALSNLLTFAIPLQARLVSG
jgi:hypothetical protein